MNEVAVITGASGGIGAAICEVLRADQWTVVGLDRAPSGTVLEADITCPEALEKALSRVEADIGPIGAMVACAGAIEAPQQDPLSVPLDEWERVVNVNLRGTYLSCLAAARKMSPRQRGAIVTIGSLAALCSMPLHAYGPAKAAVVSMTENLAAAWGRQGIRVNCVCPGPTRTPFIEASYARGERDPATMESMTALGRLVKPEEVAHAVRFLCSDGASAMTGSTVLVDAGVRCRQLWALFDVAH